MVAALTTSRSCEGDPGPFEATFDAHWEAVSRYAARRVAPEAVQDVVSETFLVAWRRYDELNGGLAAMAAGDARRVAANQRRAGARRSALLERLRGAAACEGRGELRRATASWRQRGRSSASATARH